MSAPRPVRRAGAIACCAALAFAACAAPIRLPDAFVRLRDSGEGYRAVTSDDARIWVRDLWDPTEGNVAFWTATLKNDYVEQRGYELVDEGDVLDAAGETGRALEFTTNVRGARVGYLIALWVRGRTLQVVEFAAPQAAFAERRAAVRAALGTVRG